MPKSVLKALFVCLLASAATALPLADMPIRVGGYVYDNQFQPISGASVTFIDQTTQTEYQGTTDPSGWYGNVGFSSVPETPSVQLLGQSYPNPTTGSLTVEIASQALEKSLGAVPEEIKLYDLRGRLVGSVPASIGTHDVQTNSNCPLAEGVYLYKLGDEVKRLVGNPKRITVKASEGAAEKALVSYRRTVEAAGFVIQDELVSLDDAQINFASVNLTPAVTDIPLAIKVFNISGSEQLLDGTVTLSRGGYSQTESAGVGGIYSFTIPASVDSVRFFVDGFVGYDHATNQIFSVLNPDSVAVRGWIADDHKAAAVASLPSTVFVELVPEVRLNDQYFMESAGLDARSTVIRHRNEDVRFVTRLNTKESGYTLPADPVALGRLRVERDHYFTILDGGNFDRIALLIYTSTETTAAPVNTLQEMQGRHDIYVDNSAVPGNARSDFFSDGDIDYASSHIPNYASQGDAREEIANPTEMYDNQINGLVSGIENDDYYCDLVHTVMKSKIRRNY